jgi:hypothetical protein
MRYYHAGEVTKSRAARLLDIVVPGHSPPKEPA